MGGGGHGERQTYWFIAAKYQDVLGRLSAENQDVRAGFHVPRWVGLPGRAWAEAESVCSATTNQ
jgi:hypothetical protein